MNGTTLGASSWVVAGNGELLLRDAGEVGVDRSVVSTTGTLTLTGQNSLGYFPHLHFDHLALTSALRVVIRATRVSITNCTMIATASTALTQPFTINGFETITISNSSFTSVAGAAYTDMFYITSNNTNPSAAWSIDVSDSTFTPSSSVTQIFNVIYQLASFTAKNISWLGNSVNFASLLSYDPTSNPGPVPNITLTDTTSVYIPSTTGNGLIKIPYIDTFTITRCSFSSSSHGSLWTTTPMVNMHNLFIAYSNFTNVRTDTLPIEHFDAHNSIFTTETAPAFALDHNTTSPSAKIQIVACTFNTPSSSGPALNISSTTQGVVRLNMSADIQFNASSTSCKALFVGRAPTALVVYLDLAIIVPDLCIQDKVNFSGNVVYFSDKLTGSSNAVLGTDRLSMGPATLSSITILAPSTVPYISYLPHYPPTDSIVLGSGTTLGITNFQVEWNLPFLPDAGSSYRLINSTSATMTTSSPYNVSYATQIDSVWYTFNPATCGGICASANSKPCVYTNQPCSCTSGWVGPNCDCLESSVPNSFGCSPSGGSVWTSNTSTTISSVESVVLPPNYGLDINGDLVIAGNLAMSNGSTLTVRGSLTVHNTGVLGANMTLLEYREASSCIVYSTVSIQAQQFAFDSSSKAELFLDISDLSMDVSCVTPNDSPLHELFNATMLSLSSTTMSPQAVWIVHVVGEGRRSSAPSPDTPVAGPPNSPTAPSNVTSTNSTMGFNVVIVNSKDKSGSIGASTQLITTTSNPDECARITSAPGLLSLYVSSCSGMPSETSPSASPSGRSKAANLKWYYYGAPIIAALAVAIIVLIAVFAIPDTPCQRWIMPYYKANM